MSQLEFNFQQPELVLPMPKKEDKTFTSKGGAAVTMVDLGEPVSVYTSEDAVEDGMLVNVGKIKPEWSTGFVSHITVGLLDCGYYKTDDQGKEYINLANCWELLIQAQQIVKSSHRGKWLIDGASLALVSDWFYSGEIELPSGDKQEIFIEQNETGYYTLLLPEDH